MPHPAARLVDALNAGLEPDCRLTLVCAPAGHGKTLPPCEWLEAHRERVDARLTLSIAWWTPERSDDDLALFVRYLVAALQPAQPGIGAGLGARWDGMPDRAIERTGAGGSGARMDPDGSPITVLTGPLRDQAALRGVLARLWDLALEVDLAYPETVETASRTITALFVDAPIPAEVAGAIAQAYAALPGLSPAVAVRSSATAEDLPTASF